MKRLTRSLLIAGAMITASSANATFLDDICLLMGIDYQEIWMKEKKRIFGQTLPKAFPGTSIYVGARLSERLGLELGYDWTAKKSTEFVPGIGKLSIQRSGNHLDLLGYFPIVNCLELVGVLGIGNIRPKIQSAVGGVTTTLSSNSTVVVRARFGLNCLLTDCVGIRGLIGWESTNRIRLNANVGPSAFDNSYTAAAGVYFKF